MNNLIRPDFKKNVVNQINNPDCKGQVLDFCKPMPNSKRHTQIVEPRLVRIKSSLIKINNLMAELRSLNN